jgi:hypothetical protein
MVIYTMRPVCEECRWELYKAFRDAFEWPITDFDRCAFKGHKYGEWRKVSQAGEIWEERVCAVCTMRETRKRRRWNKTRS